jgi:hypothetical protein
VFYVGEMPLLHTVSGYEERHYCRAFSELDPFTTACKLEPGAV